MFNVEMLWLCIGDLSKSPFLPAFNQRLLVLSNFLLHLYAFPFHHRVQPHIFEPSSQKGGEWRGQQMPTAIFGVAAP